MTTPAGTSRGAVTDQMQAWVLDAADDLCLGDVESVQVIRDMPWAVVARVDTARGTYWFKVNDRAFAYEAELLETLRRNVDDLLLHPLAINRKTGWFLSPDGGPLATESDTAAAGIVDAYVDVQIASVALINDLIAVGVPDRRPAVLPALLEELLEHDQAAGLRPRLVRSMARFVEACELLTADGLVSIANTDVKHEHVFVGPPLKLYDWGDAVVSHPFASLMNIDRMEHGTSGSLRASLLDRWDTDKSDPAVSAAGSAECVLRADVCRRVPPGGHEIGDIGVRRWLTTLADLLDEAT